ncbi:hypothetical protein ACIQ9P_06260 [Kitasatospora sp. NPDC094019]|uniref:hypothetical protein n=1 Tax=Kitasatospora sp. NPDC094019 TaxID=3364091 RepID=UPI0037F65CA3
MSLTDLRDGFRDDEQLRRARRVVHDRLADDRDPQECRYLMRFWWQLGMTYQEVSMEQLGQYVGRPKLDVIEELISAVRAGHAEIDAWADMVEWAFPVTRDRGYEAAIGSAG